MMVRCYFAAAVVIAGAVTGCGYVTDSATATSAQSSETTKTPESPPPLTGEDAEMNGRYVLRYDDGAVDFWTLKSCGPGCADVSASTPKPWTERAKLDKTRWTVEVMSPQGIACADGTLLASNNTFSWEAKSLEGVYTNAAATAGCNYAKGDVTETRRFTMSERTDDGPRTPGAPPTPGQVNAY